MSSENSEYIVSARKYRPLTFESVVGQPVLTRTLRNAVASDRIAQAYLFCGPRGVGKTSCARIFARTINCEHRDANGDACGECESCRQFQAGSNMNVVELDAASNNSVDDIRNLTEQVRVPPQLGRYRVFIIDEVHMLSPQAFNAFLKTLEEPPKYVVFVLATTEKQKVLPTILSRCQVYDFNRITVDDIADHLEYVAGREGITTEREALDVIARKADGAMRDALSIFDQVAASCNGNVTYKGTIANLNVLDYEYYFRLFDAFRTGDVQDALLIYKEVRDAGFDSRFFITGLGQHLRNLMVAATPQTVGLLEVSGKAAERFMAQAKAMPLEWYYRAMAICNECDLQYRNATNKQFLIELALIRLCGAPTGAPADKPAPLPKPTPSAATPADKPAAAVQGAAPANKTAAPAAPTRTAQTAAPRVNATPQRPTLRTPQMQTGGRVATSMRLHGEAPAAAAEQKGEPAADDPGARRPFSRDELIKAWHGFMEENRAMHILVSAMRSHEPEAESDTAYRMMVDNPAQQEVVEQAMLQLLGYLRGAVGNSSLTLRTEVVPQGERTRILTSGEFLKQVLTENDVLARALKEWDAELA